MSLEVSMTKTVGSYHFGKGSLKELAPILASRRQSAPDSFVVFVVDHFFRDRLAQLSLPQDRSDFMIFVDCRETELTTDDIDEWTSAVRDHRGGKLPVGIVSIGGGSTLDAGKAISNLLTNGGRAENYQGWNLVKVPGVYKIGIPTLHGTGAEASRTCVMKNKAKNLKLGMNSPFTVYDHLILDPTLSASVPRDQYFFTAMDTYVHCVESLHGNFRHPIADAYSKLALDLVREVMLSADMMSDGNREKMMIASYFGGSAIGNSFVGVVHPLSAGLSMVFGTHHCLANCIVMRQMEDFYPEETREFLEFCRIQKIELPNGICVDRSDQVFSELYGASTIHDKPLTNALGPDFKKILTFDRVKTIFARM